MLAYLTYVHFFYPFYFVVFILFVVSWILHVKVVEHIICSVLYAPYATAPEFYLSKRFLCCCCCFFYYLFSKYAFGLILFRFPILFAIFSHRKFIQREKQIYKLNRIFFLYIQIQIKNIEIAILCSELNFGRITS